MGPDVGSPPTGHESAPVTSPYPVHGVAAGATAKITVLDVAPALAAAPLGGGGATQQFVGDASFVAAGRAAFADSDGACAARTEVR